MRIDYTPVSQMFNVYKSLVLVEKDVEWKCGPGFTRVSALESSSKRVMLSGNVVLVLHAFRGGGVCGWKVSALASLSVSARVQANVSGAVGSGLLVLVKEGRFETQMLMPPYAVQVYPSWA